eukprot:538423-Pleurochrysis_carterae.AAC.1
MESPLLDAHALLPATPKRAIALGHAESHVQLFTRVGVDAHAHARAPSRMRTFPHAHRPRPPGTLPPLRTPKSRSSCARTRTRT